MHRTLAVVVVVGLVGAIVRPVEGVSIEVSSAPTTGLDGHTTFVLTAVSDSDGQIQGFDFYGNGSTDFCDPDTYGFFGLLAQQSPGAGLSTVWNDFNAIIDPAQDSQFAFNTGDVNIVPGSASESDSHLQAAFAGAAPFGTSVLLAQLVAPDSGDLMYRGKVIYQEGGPPAELVMGVSGYPCHEPDPVPQVTVTPTSGSMIDFIAPPGTPHTLVGAISLASTGDPGSVVSINGLEIDGPDASQFEISSFAPIDLLAGESVVYDVSYLGGGGPGVTATATFQTSLGDVFYDFVTPIPEPATLWLVCLALLAWITTNRKS